MSSPESGRCSFVMDNEALCLSGGKGCQHERGQGRALAFPEESWPRGAGAADSGTSLVFIPGGAARTEQEQARAGSVADAASGAVGGSIRA